MSKNRISKETEAFKKAKESLLVKLGERIYNFRKVMSLSQEALAKIIQKDNIISKWHDLYQNKSTSKNDEVILDIDFSSKVLSRYELGKTEMGLIAFINICIGLRKTPNDLLKDIIADIDFEQPEILKLYGQLDDEYKNLAIEYLKYLLFKQNKDRNSTLK